jgi:cytochrome c peroxidase
MLRISSGIWLVVALSGCGSSTNIPSGTGTGDGRAATLAVQAPFVTAFEMANADAAAVLVKRTAMTRTTPPR